MCFVAQCSPRQFRGVCPSILLTLNPVKSWGLKSRCQSMLACRRKERCRGRGKLVIPHHGTASGSTSPGPLVIVAPADASRTLKSAFTAAPSSPTQWRQHSMFAISLDFGTDRNMPRLGKWSASASASEWRLVPCLQGSFGSNVY